jgi:hypothetical protein
MGGGHRRRPPITLGLDKQSGSTEVDPATSVFGTDMSLRVAEPVNPISGEDTLRGSAWVTADSPV